MDRESLASEVLRKLRRIVRATDLHSRRLVLDHGVTVPQLLLMKELQEFPEGLNPSELARRLHLSKATITDILGRLLKREWLIRTPDDQDRRRARVSLSELGSSMLRLAPPLLQERFLEQFAVLSEWEQLQILAALSRVAELMDIQELPVAPVLASGPMASVETKERASSKTPSSTPENARSRIVE